MNLNEYQDKAKATAVFPKKDGLVYTTLGLVGEAGEVAEKVKKAIRDFEGVVDSEKLIKEVGDVLWYIAVLSDQLGYTLEEVASLNIEKLASRQKRGVLKGSGDQR